MQGSARRSPRIATVPTPTIWLMSLWLASARASVEPRPPVVRVHLEEAIARAVIHAPAMLGQRDLEREVMAAGRATRRYPWNPFVQVQVLPYAQRGAGGIAHYILLMQAIELGGQSMHRRAIASATREQAQAQTRVQAVREGARAARAFFVLWYRHELAALAGASPVDVGEGVEPVPASRSDAELARLVAREAERHDVHQAALDEREAMAALAEQIDAPPGAVIQAIGDPRRWSWQTLREPVVADACDAAECTAARAAWRAADAAVRFARASRVPSLLIGPYYQRSPDGIASVGLRFQIELPVVDGGGRQQALRRAEATRLHHAWQQGRTQIARRRSVAGERYDRTRTEVLAACGRLHVAVAELERRDGRADGSSDPALRAETRARAARLELDMVLELALAAVDAAESIERPVTDLVAIDRDTP